MRLVDGNAGGVARLLLALMLPGLAGLAGCRDLRDGETSAAAAPLTVPLPPVTDYVILAARAVNVGRAATLPAATSASRRAWGAR